MVATPPSPAWMLGRLESRRHPHALGVGVHCSRDGGATAVHCLVGVVQHDGTRRCASVHLTAQGRRWLLARWRRTLGCAPLAPASRTGSRALYD